MAECICAEKADMRLMFGRANGSKCVARLRTRRLSALSYSSPEEFLRHW